MNKQSNPQGYRYRNRRNRSFSGKNSIITTIITGIAGVVMKDVLSENSKIKGLIKHVFKRKHLEAASEKKMIEADFSVIKDKTQIKIKENEQIGEKK